MNTSVKIPFNDLKRQNDALDSEIREAIDRVLDSGLYIFGRELEKFEDAFGEYVGCGRVIGVGNGTDALEIALRALDCGPGDEVVTVANAGGYATTAAVLVGATPVYVDVDAETLLMSPDSLKQALTERTKAVVITHLYGAAANLGALMEVLKSHGHIGVIEDCAQAHGAEYKLDKVGTFGDLATFSFYPTKNLGALGDAGCVVTSDQMLADRVKRISQYGWANKYESKVPYGRNSRMDEIQAAVLTEKLKHLDKWNERRRSIVTRYNDAAKDSLLSIVHAGSPAYVAHLCVARHPERDAFRDRMHECGVQTGVHYPVLDHEQESMKNVAWRKVDLTNSEKAIREIVSLPCFPEMTDEEIELAGDAIRKCS